MNKISDLRQLRKKKKKNDSVILSLLSRLYIFIRCNFATGIFSGILCACADREKKFADGLTVSLLKNSSVSKFIKKQLNRFSRFVEESTLNDRIRTATQRMLTRSSRDYGIFLASSGVYVLVAFVVNRFLREAEEMSVDSLYSSAILFLLSGLFVFSKETVSTVLCKNKLLEFFTFEIFGAKRHVIYERDDVTSNPSLPVLLGIPMGLLCIFFPPFSVLKLLLILFISFLVLFKTDIGILALLASVPFCDEFATTVFASVTFVSYISKLIRNKKSFRLELSDAFIILSVLSVTVCALFFGADGMAASTVKLICCLLIYFCVKNSVRSLSCIKRCMTVQLFALFGVCAYFVIFTALSDTAFISSIFPLHLSSVFSGCNTVAVYLICTMPYLTVAFKDAKRKRDRLSLAVILLLVFYIVFSTYSYAVCMCAAVCFSVFMLTYSPKSFARFTVLAPALALLSWYASKLTPSFSAYGGINSGATALANAVDSYGIIWLAFTAVACAVFFGYALSYTNEYYFDITHKKSMTRAVCAPVYSVLFLAICAVFVPNVETDSVMLMFFLQTSLGMATTAYAREQDGIESRWYTGGRI